MTTLPGAGSVPLSHHEPESHVVGRRRLLVCTPFPPRLDARHGGKATAQLLARLATRHDIALLCLRRADQGPVDDVFLERCAKVEEVILPQIRFNSVRRVRWLAGAARGLPPWATDCRSDAYAERLRALAAEWRPEVMEFHLQVMAQYVSALRDTAVPKILVDYDPPSAWAAELVLEARGARRLVRRVELALWRRYERATRPFFSAIVVFAQRDASAVARAAAGIPVVTIPLAFELAPEALDPIGATPPTIVFVGGFGHPPNVDAARWLAGSIFPRVSDRVPEARLDLVGDSPGEEVRRLAGDRVAVHGSVPDVTPYLNAAAVVVAPLRLGGSMRGKVLEALGAGKALVATPRAAEGVVALPGRHFELAATETELVDVLAGLLLDSERRRALAVSARGWAVEHLSWEPSLSAFERLYSMLQSGTAAGAAPPTADE
jgi:glycosyltransferase involved in cell wall biosynthesis